MTDPWLEWVSASVFVNESTNSTSLMGTVCASTGLVFVCGGYSPWAYLVGTSGEVETQLYMVT